MTGGKAVCQVTYNIWRVDSSNTITEFTRICASLMGVTESLSTVDFEL